MSEYMYLVSGSRDPWNEWHYTVRTLGEAREIAADKLQQGERCVIYDVTTRCVVLELTLRYDGLGIA